MKAAFFLAFFALFMCSFAYKEYDDYYPKKYTLVDIVSKTNQYTILVKLLKATDLLEAAVKAENVTIFAPSNYAFKATAKELGCEYVEYDDQVIKCLSTFLKLEDVKMVLLYHIVPGIYDLVDLYFIKLLTALNGKKIKRVDYELIDLAAGITNPKIVKGKSDIHYDNGMVHTINRVLIPFINIARPCDLIEKTVVMRNEMFIDLLDLKRTIKRCFNVRAAMKKCLNTMVCPSAAASKPFAKGFTLGEAVADVTACKFVADEVSRCAAKLPEKKKPKKPKYY